jgi:hypothetical protein
MAYLRFREKKVSSASVEVKRKLLKAQDSDGAGPKTPQKPDGAKAITARTPDSAQARRRHGAKSKKRSLAFAPWRPLAPAPLGVCALRHPRPSGFCAVSAVAVSQFAPFSGALPTRQQGANTSDITSHA